MSKQPIQVTIIVSPRERFSYTRQSLESIYEHTELPFKLIYVDGNSPRKVKQYLEARSQELNFELIRTDYHLSPNHARNLGLTMVDTKYVLFADNDIIVSPGWLKALVDCAETTNADVVGPLKTILQPIVDKLVFGINNRLLQKLVMYGLLAPGEKLLNHYLTSRYAQRYLKDKG